MKAIVCNSFGTPDTLAFTDLPEPLPGRNEVQVKITAATVNFADLLMIAGRYQVKPPLPFVPGLEFVGRVAAIGEAVTKWRVGERVMGAPSFGAFAETIACEEDRVFAVPDGMADEVAAGFTIAYGTAGYALLVRAEIRAGDWVLVTGATGGVGMAAIDIAKRMGAKVIAAVGSPAKADAALTAGAEHAVDYSRPGWNAALKELTGGAGLDVILDNVGGEVFDLALRASAPMARILVVGFAGGTIPRIAAEYLLVKNITVHGVGFGGAIARSPVLAQQTLSRLAALHRAKPFEPHVAASFALADVPKALGTLGARNALGKLLIRIGD